MKFSYRLVQLGASSAKYGDCEICGKNVSDMYIQTKQHEKKIAGKDRIINDSCTFGHRKCLEQIRNKEELK